MMTNLIIRFSLRFCSSSIASSFISGFLAAASEEWQKSSSIPCKSIIDNSWTCLEYTSSTGLNCRLLINFYFSLFYLLFGLENHPSNSQDGFPTL